MIDPFVKNRVDLLPHITPPELYKAVFRSICLIEQDNYSLTRAIDSSLHLFNNKSKIKKYVKMVYEDNEFKKKATKKTYVKWRIDARRQCPELSTDIKYSEYIKTIKESLNNNLYVYSSTVEANGECFLGFGSHHKGYFYVMDLLDGHYKVGYSEDIKKRKKSLQTSRSQPISIIAFFPSDIKLETAIKNFLYSEYTPEGGTEVFPRGLSRLGIVDLFTTVFVRSLDYIFRENGEDGSKLYFQLLNELNNG